MRKFIRTALLSSLFLIGIPASAQVSVGIRIGAPPDRSANRLMLKNRVMAQLNKKKVIGLLPCPGGVVPNPRIERSQRPTQEGDDHLFQQGGRLRGRGGHEHHRWYP